MNKIKYAIGKNPNSRGNTKGKHWSLSKEIRLKLKIIHNRPEVKMKQMGKMSDERKKGMKGHTGAYPRKEEWKRKVSLKLKGHPFWGINHPCKEETKKKIGLANKGHIVIEETRQKIKESRAKQIFPIKDTSIEIKIQNFLKQLHIEFFTHQYMHIEHGYQCDILIPSMNIVIECDGDFWHGNISLNNLFKGELLNRISKQRNLDDIRTKELTEKGYKVIRLWEHDIKRMDLNELKEKIRIEE